MKSSKLLTLCASFALLSTLVPSSVKAADVIMDNTDGSGGGITITGSWTSSTATTGYWGSNYIHDGNTGKGTKKVKYAPPSIAAGDYFVYARWGADPNRATVVPIFINYSGGSTTVNVNQTGNSNTFYLLGKYTFATSGGYLEISNTGTTGYVVADAVKFSTTPPTPSAPQVTEGDTQVTLNWAPITGATGYNVKRATVSGGPYTTVASNTTTIPYPDTGLTNGTGYYYVITALNGSVESLPSAEVGATPTNLLSPWKTEDVGAVGVLGKASFASGTFSATGGGADIGTGAADAFRFIHQSGPATSDFSVIARVASIQTGANGLAKAGVLVRDSVAPGAGAIGLSLMVTPSNGIIFQKRLTNGGTATTVATLASVTAPYWVKIVKVGGTYTASTAPDVSGSVGSWSTLGSVTITMNSPDIGFGVSSHVAGTLCTATFDNTTPTSPPPAAPTALTATALNAGEIDLGWTASSGATSYKIERSLTSGSGFSQLGSPTTGTTFPDTSVSESTTYYYRVLATNPAGDSAPSTEASATTPAALPATPTGLTLSGATATGMTATWTAGAGGGTVVNYKLERQPSGGSWSTVSSTIAAGTTTYNDTGLSAFTNYTYRVSATNTGGASTPSTTASATTLDTIPAVPGTPSIVNKTSHSVDISWADNSNNPGGAGNETGFIVERKTGAGAFAYLATVGASTGTTVPWTDNSVASGTSYYYRVSATNTGGTSSPSAQSAVAATSGSLITTPGAPSVVADVNDPTKINVTWTPSTGTNSIILEWSATGNADDFHVIQTYAPNAGGSYAATGLNSFTTYYYRIRVTDSTGLNNSSYATSSATTILLAPTNFAIAVLNPNSASSQIQVSWTNNDPAHTTAIRVDRKIGTGSYVTGYATLGGTATTYTNGPNLALDTTYTYRVVASNGSIKSPFTPELSITLMGDPVIDATAVSPTAIDVKCTSISPSATGYKVERSPDTDAASRSWSEVAGAMAPTATFHDTALSANTTYIYRVRSYRTASGTDAGGYSNYSALVNDDTQIGGSLPSPWVHADIGAPGLVGDAGYASGVFTIKGGGNDYDNLHYVYQPINATDNATIIARVTSIDNTDPFAKAGLMIRESTATGAKFVMLSLTPGYGHGTSFSYRTTTSGSFVSGKSEDNVGAPYWLKLTRSGDVFSGFISSDGSTWVLAGTITIPMTGTGIVVGMPVFSHIATLCKAVMDNVSVTTTGIPAVPAAPTALTVTPYSSSQLNLSWTDNSTTETGFTVERKSGSAGTWAPIATVAPVSGTGTGTYSNTGLAAGEYFYRVLAFNAGGVSAYTNEAGAITVGAPTPSFCSQGKTAIASSGTASGANDGDMATYWQPSDTFDQWWKVDLGASYSITRVVTSWYFPDSRWYSYKIETSTDDSSYTTAVNKWTSQVIPHGDTKDVFAAVTARYVRVTVHNSNATISPKTRIFECRVYRAGTEPAGATLPTSNQITNVGTNQLTFNWVDNSSNETGFRIERQTGSTGSWTQIATVGNNVTSYTDLLLTPGKTYSYRVMAYSDTDGTALDYSDVATGTTTSVSSGFTRQYWSGPTGANVSDLTTWITTHGTPTGSDMLNNLEGPFDWADNYGQIITGSVHAPATGNYTFWIASDNASELWLSTDPADTTGANAVKIAEVLDGTNQRDWIQHSEINGVYVSQTSQSKYPTISLTAGQSYYIKVLHKAATGASGPEHVAVAWQGPGFTRQVLTDAGSPLVASITSPSDGSTISEGSNLTINVSATAGSGRSINKVEFILGLDTKNEKKLGEDTTSPYSFTWNSVASGSYVLIARTWDNNGVSTDSKVKVMVTNSTFGSGTWAERILNGDGTINWTEYANVANSYETRSTLEYRLGPSYTYYHPSAGSFHTLINQSGENGISGHTYFNGAGSTDWYSEGGQMIFSPNTSAPSKYQPGCALAWNGDVYPFANDASLNYCFVNGVQWNNEDGHGQSMPDTSVSESEFVAANGGTTPTPVATVRTRALGGITGFTLFRNGYILAGGNSAQTDNYKNATTLPKYPFIQLAGKVPTAGAVTLNNEFLLVTVWDTTNHKGQVAVISVDGEIRAQQGPLGNSMGEFFWGHPNRFTVRALKLLGYIDLPFAAPTAISASCDAFADGVGEHDADYLSAQLDSQGNRDQWLAGNGPAPTADDRKTSTCGYAVIASRAESKVAFLDLQPLFDYYRKMYFTTQANYNQTKNQGPADTQWPFTFAAVSEQVPTFCATTEGPNYNTISVTNPTALMAGPPVNPKGGNGSSNLYRPEAFIATMSGHLLIYNVNNLMTSAAGGTIGSATTDTTTGMGKNPTSIDNNLEFVPGGSLAGSTPPTAINCRGDKMIVITDPTGVIKDTLTDSRIQDPVYTTVSQNGRTNSTTYLLHVMDFEGSQIETFRYGITGAEKPPIQLPSGETGTMGFEFTHIDPLPGSPFMFSRMGVN